MTWNESLRAMRVNDQIPLSLLPFPSSPADPHDRDPVAVATHLRRLDAAAASRPPRRRRCLPDLSPSHRRWTAVPERPRGNPSPLTRRRPTLPAVKISVAAGHASPTATRRSLLCLPAPFIFDGNGPLLLSTSSHMEEAPNPRSRASPAPPLLRHLRYDMEAVRHLYAPDVKPGCSPPRNTARGPFSPFLCRLQIRVYRPVFQLAEIVSDAAPPCLPPGRLFCPTSRRGIMLLVQATNFPLAGLAPPSTKVIHHSCHR